MKSRFQLISGFILIILIFYIFPIFTIAQIPSIQLIDNRKNGGGGLTNLTALEQKVFELINQTREENGLKNLYLGTVTILQAALRFYERNHFITIPKEALPADFPIMRPDNVFCQLELNPTK